MVKEFKTKDSGERNEYSSGMKRDTEKGKPRMDLLWVRCMPYEEQFLVRYGYLRARGADKYCETYTDINCEKAKTYEEYCRYKSSFMRHATQWMCGDGTEDHAVACLFNLQMAEMVRWKLEKDGEFPEK